MSGTNALEWHATNLIAQGCLTNSKHPDRFIKGIYPTHALKGYSSTLYCSDGKHYIDYICGLGTNLIGYDNIRLITDITATIQKGISHSLPTIYEIILAETIQSIAPVVERIKFLMTGSEACTAAVRISRAATGRQLILTEGYHGWHDIFTSLTPPANGIQDLHHIMQLKDNEDKIKDAACVIIEPVMTDLSKSRIDFLNKLREDCTRHGTVLIFDETITALRFPKFFAYKYLNINPDLLIFGKALGNGMPISSVGGRKEIMESDYFVSSTYAGNILSMQAGITVIKLLLGDKKYSLETLWNKGEDFIKQFNELCGEYVTIEGYNTRGVLKGRDDLTKAIFMQECAKAGVLFGPSWFYNFPLMANDMMTFMMLNNLMIKFKTQEMKLEGEMPTSPFSQLSRKG